MMPTAVDGLRLTTTIPAGTRTGARPRRPFIGPPTSAAGAAYCWRRTDLGQLGIGTQDDNPHPTTVAVGGGIAFAIPADCYSSGSYHSCGLTAGGVAYCWGLNDRGQLGDGTTTNRSTPVPAAVGMRFTSISVSGSHTCGLTSDGKVCCWGDNSPGHLGPAADLLIPAGRDFATTPVPVP